MDTGDYTRALCWRMRRAFETLPPSTIVHHRRPWLRLGSGNSSMWRAATGDE